MTTTVDVKNLTRTFGEFTAVDSISFAVQKGEIFGFLGPNGAGKSTTIKMLCGLLEPTGGEGHVADYNIRDEQEEIKKIIGYMSQRFSLYDDMTVDENLKFFGSIYGLRGKKLIKRSNYVSEMVGIEDQKNRMVGELPGGIKQRLALGTAVIHDPSIIFLDEPTSGVDPLMRRLFWEQIYAFSEEGKTIFVTTHYMDEAEHCDRIALIIAGKMFALDSPENLKKEFPHEVHLLKTENYLKAFDIISARNFAHEVALFGTDIHILTDKGEPVGKYLKTLLGKNQIDQWSVEAVEPSLEDVFVMHARENSV